MYCPNCGQQQVSDEMRFCSRCGFPLRGVRELIGSGGALVERETGAHGHLSKAFRGMRKGVWVLLASLVLFFFFGFITAVDDDFAILLLLPVLCFLIGFARLLYGAFIEGRWVKRDFSQPNVASGNLAQFGTVARSPELPAARGTPVPALSGERMQTAERMQSPGRTQAAEKTRTAEMGQPPSVTENTTKLLDDETPSPRG